MLWMVPCGFCRFQICPVRLLAPDKQIFSDLAFTDKLPNGCFNVSKCDGRFNRLFTPYGHVLRRIKYNPAKVFLGYRFKAVLNFLWVDLAQCPGGSATGSGGIDRDGNPPAAI